MRLARWAGPALTAFGLVMVAILYINPPGGENLLVWWIKTSPLAYERILPLIGLGALLGLIELRHCILAAVLFAAGVALGYRFTDLFLSAAAVVPGAVTHLFFTGPVSCLAAGAALATSAAFRGWLACVAAPVIGAMVAIAIALTDPSQQEALFPLAGIAIALWIVTAAALTVSGFRRDWFDTAGRILGSWLIAIGLLYGGASLIPRRDVPRVPQPRLPPAGKPAPGFDTLFPDTARPGRPPATDFNPGREP